MPGRAASVRRSAEPNTVEYHLPSGESISAAAWLGYIAAVVAVTAMVAVSFGGRATAPFVGDNAGPSWDNALTTAVVLLMVGVNLVDAKFVARA